MWCGSGVGVLQVAAMQWTSVPACVVTWFFAACVCVCPSVRAPLAPLLLQAPHCGGAAAECCVVACFVFNHSTRKLCCLLPSGRDRRLYCRDLACLQRHLGGTRCSFAALGVGQQPARLPRGAGVCVVLPRAVTSRRACGKFITLCGRLCGVVWLWYVEQCSGSSMQQQSQGHTRPTYL
jgi:hypothetical protein